jgi:hypothetical protein
MPTATPATERVMIKKLIGPFFEAFMAKPAVQPVLYGLGLLIFVAAMVYSTAQIFLPSAP